MSVESTLTRELNIRFIDARAIATEAKLNLGIDGYVSDHHMQLAVVNEATRIFQEEKSQSDRIAMQVINQRLNYAKKSMKPPCSSSSDGSAACDDDNVSTVSSASSKGSIKKKFMKFGWA